MKRLLKISMNLAINSVIPILCWFCVGIILDKSLINVFSVTYPMQFLYSLFLHMFGTGANISKEKGSDKNAVYSSLIIGTVVTILVFGMLALHVNEYLRFMGYEVAVYKTFAIYSILFFGVSTIFNILLEKLYFEDKETLAAKYCLEFNILTIVILVCSSLLLQRQYMVVTTTLVAQLVFVIVMFIKLSERCKFKFNILSNFKYESSGICADILFLLIFLFGLKNANSFGVKYMAAINFVALITDTQWDALDAVTTVAKVDIAKGRFTYKQHIINAYILTGIMLSTSIVMFLIFYRFCNLDLVLVLKYFGFEVFNFLIWVKYATDSVLIQLNYSAVKATVIKLGSYIMRFLFSLLPTPFCTAIGQVICAIIQFMSYGAIKRRLNTCAKC